MKILVQKFGGTSVATPETREKVYEKIISAKNDGYSPVVVISAMGRKGAPYATDTLLDLIDFNHQDIMKREVDQIFSCGEIISGVIITTTLQKKGFKASYLTGMQAGILTTNDFGDARIIKVETDKIHSLLQEGKIVVVAGGQGGTSDREITTLGRGGSDTTACALGVALNAEGIDIYTDVEGIMAVDPRIVDNPEIFKEISYSFCSDMAKNGASVIHPRAVEIASQSPNTKLRVRSTFSESLGTLISNNNLNEEKGSDIKVDKLPMGIARIDNQTIYKVHSMTQVKKLNLLEELGARTVDVCDINPEEDNMLLIAQKNNEYIIDTTLNSINLDFVKIQGLSQVSVVGIDPTRTNGLIIQILRILEQNNVKVIAKSFENNAIKIWINSEYAVDGIKAIHEIILRK